MKVEVELTNYACEELLGMNGFISKEVTAYYDGSTDPYNNEDGTSDLKGVKIKIAYHRMDEPKELEKKYPMLSVLKEYEYDKVVNALFNSRLSELLFGI